MSLAKRAEKRILKGSKLRGFVTPDYNGLSLANIVPTLLKGVGLPSNHAIPEEFFDYSVFEGVENIVLFCVDGLGYSHLSKGLKKMEGIPLTSTAPSTTTTAFPTLTTGLTPQEHGIVGYWVYFRELGEVVSMLRFGPAQGTGSFEEVGIDPTIFFPFPSVFQSLAKKRISSFVVTKKEYFDSGLSHMIYRDAKQVAYKNLSDMFSQGRKLTRKGRNFIVLYWDAIDMIGHIEGTRSKKFKEEISMIDSHLQNFLENAKDNTLLLLTSDHGQINCPLKKQINYADHLDLIARLSVPPNGEGRFSYLFCKKGRKDKVKNYCEEHFSQKAILLESRDVLRKGILGRGRVFPETPHRIGDFILIPKRDYVFTYPYAEGRGVVGFHGGLSREEMLVPFLWKRI